MNMTSNERIRSAVPYQGIRTLNCRHRFFLPRGRETLKLDRRESTRKRRIRHGIARAFEDLRRVRMSLVPRSDPRECLLPGV